MKVVHAKDVTLEEVNAEGASATKIRWLISQKDDAPNFAMRLFEIEPGGHTPLHKHDWEHEVFIVDGEGVLVFEDGEKPFITNDAIYVESGKMHQFKNTGSKLLKFLCMIPHEKPVVKKTINPFAGGKANNC
ncbi:MAG TPA: cupin domain-containing protein [Candidatus Cloacimonadota bacterium]|nr:cupin domain-containing protein [Candidatus Cloacimonadota bacterium]HPT72917.1 cupin domain-containing protein [Candidatus Cloacimonadota bacterium]